MDRKQIEQAVNTAFTSQYNLTGPIRVQYLVDFVVQQVNAAREEDAEIAAGQSGNKSIGAAIRALKIP